MTGPYQVPDGILRALRSNLRQQRQQLGLKGRAPRFQVREQPMMTVVELRSHSLDRGGDQQPVHAVAAEEHDAPVAAAQR